MDWPKSKPASRRRGQGRFELTGAGSGTRRAGKGNLPRRRSPRRRAHAFEHEVGVTVEGRDAIFEGAGLAFVGIADDDFRPCRGVAGAGPFDGGGEAGAATAQVGSSISASQPSRPRWTAAEGLRRYHSRPSKAPSRRRMLSSTGSIRRATCSTGRCWRISSAISLIRRWLSWPMARPLTSIAGPWSQSPVPDVVVTLTRPSSETLPGSIHSLRQRGVEQLGVAEHAVGDVVGEQRR